MKSYFILSRYSRIASAITILCTVVASCQSKGDPNPCEKLAVPSAGFTIKEEVVGSIGQGVRRYEVDTVGADRWDVPIVFTADDSTNADYEWRIGTDPRVFTTRSVKLAFNNNSVGPVTAILQVKKRNESGCPAIDGKLSTTNRSLTVVLASKAPIYGDYEGYNMSNPSHKFTIHIQPNSLLNLPEGCTYDLRDELIIGSTALVVHSSTFDPAYGAGSLHGWGALNSQNKRQLVFDYSYSNPANPTPGPPISDRFIGYRK